MSDQELFSQRGVGLVGYVPEIVRQAMICKWSKGTSGPAGDEHHNLIAHTLRVEEHDASEDGTGRQNLVVMPINTQVGLRHNALGERTGLGIGDDGSPAFTLQGAHSHAVAIMSPVEQKPIEGTLDAPIAFAQNQRGEARLQGGDGSIVGCLGANEGMTQRTYIANCLPPEPLAFAQNQLGEVRMSNVAGTLNRNSNPSGRNAPLVHLQSSVRRLTPKECERLQGFPDGYTAIQNYRAWRDLDEHENPEELTEAGYQVRQTKKGVWRVNDPDGPRYKALGNSMAVDVMRWLGVRLRDAILEVRG